MAEGKRLVGHGGTVLLRRCADRTGLTDALSGVLPSSTATGWRDRAGVLVHLAIAIVLGARYLSEAEQLHLHHRPLLGPLASDSTARRTLAALDEATLARIAKVRARVRRHVWSLLRLRPGGFPWLVVACKRLTGWIVIDLDATKVSRLESGRGAEDVRVLRAVARELGIDPHRLGLAAASDACGPGQEAEGMHR